MEKTPPVHNTVCYLSFLSAECSMKGFLLQNHLHPVPDTHDLRELCQLCGSFQANYLELEDDCDFLTQFATPSGFPSFERATQEDAAELRAYLAKHLRPGETVELWNLWVGDGPARPRRFSGALGDVELDTLKQLEENFQTCLTIRI